MGRSVAWIGMVDNIYANDMEGYIKPLGKKASSIFRNFN